MSQYGQIFTEDTLQTIFPPERTEAFFEALFGDAEEGSCLLYTSPSPRD